MRNTMRRVMIALGILALTITGDTVQADAPIITTLPYTAAVSCQTGSGTHEHSLQVTVTYLQSASGPQTFVWYTQNGDAVQWDASLTYPTGANLDTYLYLGQDAPYARAYFFPKTGVLVTHWERVTSVDLAPPTLGCVGA